MNSRSRTPSIVSENYIESPNQSHPSLNISIRSYSPQTFPYINQLYLPRKKQNIICKKQCNGKRDTQNT